MKTNSHSQNNELQQQVQSMRRFNRFYTNILGILNEMYLGLPVGLSEARMLFEINYDPGCKAVDLVNRLNMDRGYVSRTISRLEKLDFIVRRPSPHDGRVLSLYPSSSGKALMQVLNSRAEDQLVRMLKPLSADERHEMVRSMQRIQELLNKHTGK